MNTTDQIVPVVAGVNLPLSAHRKWSAVWIMLVLLTFCAARADAQDKDYLVIYGIMGQADTLSAGGQTSQAHAKYAEAQLALARFQRENPAWNIKTVSFRLTYLAEKLAAKATKTVAPENNDAGSEPRTALHLHPRVGDQQTVIMTMKMAMTTSAAGKEMPAMDMPAMLMTMDFGVKDISAAGDITYTMVFSDATVAADTNTPPAIAAAMKSSLASIRGMTGTG